MLTVRLVLIGLLLVVVLWVVETRARDARHIRFCASRAPGANPPNSSTHTPVPLDVVPRPARDTAPTLRMGLDWRRVADYLVHTVRAHTTHRLILVRLVDAAYQSEGFTSPWDEEQHLQCSNEVRSSSCPLCSAAQPPFRHSQVFRGIRIGNVAYTMCNVCTDWMAARES